MQQFTYTRGKNSTDSALIIDAMDLLYAANVEGLVIVSSDSDFTRLATRLRESGMTVFGLGRRNTPAPFVAVVTGSSISTFSGRRRRSPRNQHRKTRSRRRFCPI